MSTAISALYEPMIERDLDASRRALTEFRREHSIDELFQAVARFAVLAYAPSQHSKHAVLSCVAASDLRDQLGERFGDVLIECALYAAESRQPWSEPPIPDPPAVASNQRKDSGELLEAIAAGDRLRGERWLAARLDDSDLARDLFLAAAGDVSDLGHSLIVATAAWKLAALFGEHGRFPILRIAVWEMTSRHPEWSGGLQAAERRDGGSSPALPLLDR